MQNLRIGQIGYFLIYEQNISGQKNFGVFEMGSLIQLFAMIRQCTMKICHFETISRINQMNKNDKTQNGSGQKNHYLLKNLFPIPEFVRISEIVLMGNKQH